MSIAHIVGESNGYMKCEVAVDASPEECAAYNYNIMSRKNKKINDRKDVLCRLSKNLNRHSKDFFIVRDFGYGLRPRQFMARHVWKRLGGGGIVHVVETIQHSTTFSDLMKKNHVATSFQQYRLYVPISSKTGNISTKLKYVSQTSLGGFVPSQMVKLTAVNHMADYIDLRQNFSKDFEEDSGTRKLLLECIMENIGKSASKVENNELERGKLLSKNFQISEGRKETIKTNNDTFKIAISFS